MRRFGLLLALLLGAPAALALDAAGLVESGHLQLRTELAPAGPVVPRQKFNVYITVAADGWFAGGTRIRIPEVPGLILLQTEQFASNSSENRRGTTWVVQRWTLDGYATAAGEFTTGPIALDLQVNTGDGVAAGRVQAPPVTIAASIPAELEAGQWVAAPSFRASQQLAPTGTELRPGDAITRTITLQAADVLDKMLPPVEATEQPGLAAYPRPPRLESTSNRGESTARRVQEITYIAEQPGTYTLPAYEFAWWDTAEGRLRDVTLEGVTLTVSGAPVGDRVTGTRARLREHLPALLGGIAAALLATAAWRFLPWRRLFRRLAVLVRKLRVAWRRWRAPALPPRLNPWR